MNLVWTRIVTYFRNAKGSSDKEWLKRFPVALRIFAVVAVALSAAFIHQYYKYAMLIEDKLGGGSMRTNSSIYAAPKIIHLGDELSAPQLVAHLQRGGYTEALDNRVGHYRRTAAGIDFTTGPASYFRPYSASIEFNGNKVTRIVSQTENRAPSEIALEPELITNLFDGDREKRRPVNYSELPAFLVQAIVSVEDKRFFQHGGLDLLRVMKAAYVDIKEQSKEQGASTITMQLARSFWLDQDKNWRRKFAEILLTAELERRFDKKKLMELYANEVYLGRRGSFSIHGFGEASRAYFDKDIRKLTIPEAAMLAAIIQRPGYFNPFRSPDRVKQRRDLVLTMMHANGFIDAVQLTSALTAPIDVRPGRTESSDAPYFVDLVNKELDEQFKDWDFGTNAYRVYSTLDLNLQRDAVEAMQAGMEEVDKQLRRSRGKKKAGPYPQAALIALDPRTGAIKALVGGRSYQDSQLNRILAKRQPGSSFKPFVYAAALNTAVDRKNNIVTAAMAVEDEPTTFVFNRQKYEPGNYHNQYYGPVTLRQALAKSMNIPTIKVAERTGFERVVKVAQDAGIESPLMATPSLALGSYEVPPIEIAEAYTIFSNRGVHVRRNWITTIRDRENRVAYTYSPKENRVLDERVAYIMTNLMEEVMRSGTAAGVRSRGFTMPAAGKTGTSRDGWFAGFTSELLTVVWVGYDDNKELELEGSKSALPVWTEFMKRAHRHREYSKPKAFEAPKGIVRADIDPTTGMLAGLMCPSMRSELFIAGTQPKVECDQLHDEPLVTETENPEKRKGIFGRFLGVFR